MKEALSLVLTWLDDFKPAPMQPMVLGDREYIKYFDEATENHRLSRIQYKKFVLLFLSSHPGVNYWPLRVSMQKAHAWICSTFAHWALEEIRYAERRYGGNLQCIQFDRLSTLPHVELGENDQNITHPEESSSSEYSNSDDEL